MTFEHFTSPTILRSWWVLSRLNQECQELVTPDDPALPVNNTDSVGVAVKGDTQVGFDCDESRLEIH